MNASITATTDVRFFEISPYTHLRILVEQRAHPTQTRDAFCRERAAFSLIKLRQREKVQPRIVRYSARKTQRAPRAQSGRLFGSRPRARLVTMSLVIHKSSRSALTPAMLPERARRRAGAEKEEACPRIRPRIAVAAERREVSAVTFIGYKSAWILC
jgi:hypothetical protein